VRPLLLEIPIPILSRSREMRQLYIDQFNSISEITGINFIQKGNRKVAACYLDGSAHPQQDKTWAVLKEKGVYISEQGGMSVSIVEWLEMYGNPDNLGKTSPSSSLPLVEQVERIFVDPIHFESTIPSSYSGNLYKFLAGIFGVDRVTSVLHKYNVGECGDEYVFWRTSSSGNVCYDSRISYGSDGKRIKGNGGYRKHKVEDGYSARALFGSHLIKSESEVCVVESEKAALILAIAEKKGRVWCATGGSSNFNGVGPEMKLYPDFDMAGSFWECFACNKNGGTECLIEHIEDKRIKGWGCVNANPNMVHWWGKLEAMDGDGPDDLVLRILKAK